MALISKVVIGRMALSHIGAKSNLESFTENTAEAFQINLWYDFSRLQALEAFDWNFARKRQALALHGDAPEGWGFRYQYPADCVKMRLLVNPVIPNTGVSPSTLTALQGADAVPFDVEVSPDGSKSILSNLDEAVALYTFDQETASMFSPLFVQSFSHILASHVAYVLTGKMDIETKQTQMFLALARFAQASNANEMVSPPPRDAEWIRGR